MVLLRLWPSDTTLAWRLRVEIAHECASALAYLHERKLIHRDIKTELTLIRLAGRDR